MERAQFSIDINAPREKVWKLLWEDASYRAWTSPFCEGSYMVSDWKEGGKTLFLSPDGSGMRSTIVKNSPHEFMSFKHLGTVKDGVEQPMDAETEAWAGALENYILTENEGQTKVTVEMDLSETDGAFVGQAFPKALEKLKAMAEE